jgi:protein-S-isoprenylcysteine O-methyltransferase Ste14
VPYEVQVEMPAISDITDRDTPLTQVRGSWSLISLLLSISVFAVAAILAVLNLRRRNDDVDWRLEQRIARLRTLSYITVLLALVPAILFFVFDDLSGARVWVNSNTILVAVAFLIVCAFIVAGLISGMLLKKNVDTQDGEFATAEGDYLPE